jgi:diacylglycerol kinase (ATP)
MRVRGSFGAWEGPALMLSTANTAAYGGGLRVVPTASATDQQLDVCCVGAIRTCARPWVLGRLLWGGHVTHPAVRLWRTQWLEISAWPPVPLYADGEFVGTTPVHLEAVPDALPVVCRPTVP